jgi:hypothetical protein
VAAVRKRAIITVENFLGDTVELTVGAIHIDTGQSDGQKDQAQASRDAPGSHGIRAQRNAKHLGVEGNHQDEGEVGGQHDDRKHPGEPAAFGDQLLEAWVGVDLPVHIVIVHWMVSTRSDAPPVEDTAILYVRVLQTPDDFSREPAGRRPAK